MKREHVPPTSSVNPLTQCFPINSIPPPKARGRRPQHHGPPRQEAVSKGNKMVDRNNNPGFKPVRPTPHMKLGNLYLFKVRNIIIYLPKN